MSEQHEYTDFVTAERVLLAMPYRVGKLEATVQEQAKHIEALECTDVFSRQVLKRIEALKRRVRLLKARPDGGIILPDEWDGLPRQSITPDPFGEYAEPKPSQPELVDGFWYILSSGSFVKVSQYKDGLFIDALSKSDGGGYVIRPATLDDLAHEVEGVKVWMVENDTHITQYINSKTKHGGPLFFTDWDSGYRIIACEYAAACHIPIITEAQWLRLKNEAGK